MSSRTRPFTIRHFVWLLIFTFVAGFVSAWTASAHAYDLTIKTVPATTGPSATYCRVYLGGTLVSQTNTTPVGLPAPLVPATDKPCNVDVLFPNLAPALGTYTVSVTSANSFGESVKSIDYVVVIGQKPNAPTGTISVTCTPGAPIVVTINGAAVPCA